MKFDGSGNPVDSAIFDDGTGKVGIGTTNPASLLNLVGTNAALTFGAQAAVDSSSFSIAVAASGGATNNSNGRSLTIKAGNSDNSADKTGGDLVLDPGAPVAPAVAFGRVLLASTGGNVGIGTTSPTAKLHVVGDVTVSGNIAAKYQDVAEWVNAVEPAAAGTVMALTERGRDEVRPAARAYDTGVAGVVSPQPGVILGERGPGKVLVAHSGRVRVKADAGYGAIRAGDLLVASPTPGHAMRSKPLTVGDAEFHRPGTLLGKAIEPLTEGTGEILVLLTLQ